MEKKVMECKAEALLQMEQVKKALERVKKEEKRTLEEQFFLCRIPAPSGKEELRAAEMKKRFLEAGLEEVSEDELHNVTGLIRGKEPDGEVILAAHMDIVFPETQDLSIREENGTYYCPGIGDDTRGLAELLSVARAMTDAGITPLHTIVFCANVCEEGLGNLAGIRRIFKEYENVRAFVSIDDGETGKIIYGATGSLRYEVRFLGQGGHSFGDFGIANPIHAMGRAIAKISEWQVPNTPKTTFSTGVVEGGTTVNTIPSCASMLIDMRSGDTKEIERLDGLLKKAVEEAVSEENERWNHKGEVRAELIEKGNRPGGSQEPDCEIVKAAMEAVKAVGLTPSLLGEGSTDSNIPISLGIPAVTVGMGGEGGGEHTTGEWYRPSEAYKGVQKNLLLILSLAGVADERCSLEE